MTVKRNDLEKYGEVILKLDGDVVVMSFNIKYIGRIETDTVTKEFQNLIESNKVKMRIEGEAWDKMLDLVHQIQRNYWL